MMHVTGLYAALAAILIVILGLRVVLYRRAHLIGLGDGDDRELRKRIRAHANAIEYVPIALILMLLLELDRTPAAWLNGFGCALIVARIAHAWGVSRHSGASPGRVLGALTTFTLLVVMALMLVWQQLPR